MTPFVIAFSTIDSEKQAKRVAKILIEEQLAACVNVIPNIHSIYQWEGKLCDETEWLLLIKTKRSNVERLKERLKKAHTYKVPELIFLPVTDGLPDYLKWLAAS